MDLLIRPERAADFDAIDQVNDLAFGQPDEGRLVRQLRQDPAFVSGLALVAVSEHTLVGYLLFTRSFIIAGEQRYPCLTLAPLAVLPAFQRRGVGSRLMEEGLRRAADAGFDAVNVLGHPDFYARFGFVQADELGIYCPMEVPPAVFRVLECVPGALQGVSGTVEYAAAFNGL
jgi:putative acetyltransferase